MTSEKGIMGVEKAFIGLGSNLGDKDENIRAAISLVGALRGAEVRKRSSIYLTEPVELSPQPWFCNTVIELATIIEPGKLLSLLQEIERGLGRETKGEGLPRSIDLDILLIGERIIKSEHLTVPHPRMLERRFVLEPLVEIAPGIVHPEWGGTMASWLERLPAGGSVIKRG